MEYYVYRADVLTHHGIRGMKWGIRRYQNKDGSLTPAGKKRRAKLEAEINKLDGKDKNSDATRQKSVSEMTNAELKAATERMNVEKNYYDAQRNLASVKPAQVSKGKQYAEKFLNDAVVPAITNATKDYIGKELKKRLGIKDDVKVNWDDKTKEQTYRKNEANKAYEDLKRANDIFEEENRRRNMENGIFGDAAKKNKAADKSDNNANRTDKSNDTKQDAKQNKKNDKSSGTGVKGEKWEHKSSEKVYEGTVEGTGTSRKNNSEPKWSSNKETVIDAEWSEVEVSSVPATVTNRGRSYVTALLESPDWSDDD